jgi:hypothetical protein
MDEIDEVDDGEIRGLLHDAVSTYEPPSGFRDEVESRARRQTQRARTGRALAMAAAVVVLLAGVAAFAAGRGTTTDTTLDMPPGSGTSPGAAACVRNTTPTMVCSTSPSIPVPGSASRGTRLLPPCAATTIPGSDGCPWEYDDTGGTGPTSPPTVGSCPEGALLVQAATDAGVTRSIGASQSFTVKMFVCLDDWVQAGIEPDEPSQEFMGGRAIFHRMNGAWTMISITADPGNPCAGLPSDVAVLLCPDEPTNPTDPVPGDLYGDGIPIVGTTCTQVPATTAMGEKSGGHILCDHSPSASTTIPPTPDANHGVLQGRVSGSGVTFAALIDIQDARGSIAVATGPDGSYGVALAPGTYTLTAVVNADVGKDCGTQTVEIVAGQTANAHFTCMGTG